MHILATKGVVVMAQVRICQITKSHPCTCIDSQVHWLLFDYHNGMLYTPAWAGVKTITVWLNHLICYYCWST